MYGFELNILNLNESAKMYLDMHEDIFRYVYIYIYPQTSNLVLNANIDSVSTGHLGVVLGCSFSKW